ncbi:glutamine-hydrolyzing carbamoyl-phosphate synthase small subunit [Clostridium botulinum C]|uniref:Carbamoyl phosphate synthase small chain n=2 Tax=Clostridium botulinum TaxID=1491 RepID=A0A9Q4TMV4_CLOBO|nr:MULTISPECIES: glutamine-hydrolyzing carbamoyl-phosphate synthase small subunit [Clostridium]AYF54269.1 carbamoyl-phosphate synthase (glutamine-hydrolyzing) small subunit [Clostridium novyi]KEI09244.1 carbamoyl phosphate synthase small subunit [Clostridium sp. K25]MCD3195823.1 glutamine-hydrolyzing carbamoyl-phosphate synthase small subunit [Clostridium botulinum C]MCD3201239.1 glutamine-hydrolyzing carbamoyl-phosphate synthase small subunit [Clostridium botulinum C]MCD3206587.1 glutamine-hy
MNGILYLEDGTVYTGRCFGKKGTTVGELVFNTSMTGYGEILTDPSYAGQIINMTYPLIGNYGINKSHLESKKIFAKGLVVRSICMNPSNYTSEETVDNILKDMNVIGIEAVDTRSITKKIRNKGTMRCVITSEDLTVRQLQSYFENVQEKNNFVKEVSTKEIYNIKGKGHKVVLMDFGAKANIIENLKLRGCDITVVPYNTTFEEIIKMNPDGVMLSNGPGDPKDVLEVVENVKKIVKVKPTFGICLGHQILALAFGADTYKMKFGHRGGNHGVYDIERDRAFITSQNHGYAVNENSIQNDELIITHINLNDRTVEGMKHKSLPVFSVQFHPEGAPGPCDTAYLFDKFMEIM